MKDLRDVIADHLQADDTAYENDRDEALRSAQRLIDAVQHAGWRFDFTAFENPSRLVLPQA